jgi:hypothetical protein
MLVLHKFNSELVLHNICIFFLPRFRLETSGHVSGLQYEVSPSDAHQHVSQPTLNCVPGLHLYP